MMRTKMLNVEIVLISGALRCLGDVCWNGRVDACRFGTRKSRQLESILNFYFCLLLS